MYSSKFAGMKTLFIHGVAHQVIGSVDAETVQLRCVDTGALWCEKEFNLLSLYLAGDLRTAADLKSQARGNARRQPETLRMEQLSEPARAETRRRIEYVVRLNNLDAFNGSRKALKAHVQDIARDLSDGRPPHITTVYRWHRKFSKGLSDVRSLFAGFSQRGGRDQCRLHPEIEGLIHDAIERALEESKTWSAEDIYLDVVQAIDLANRRRADCDQLKPPGLRTVQRRMSSVGAFDIAVARHGIKEAERQFARVGMARRADHILQIVEIDHTPVDVMVVDEQRVVIGRPVITFVLDRKSRCVLGFFLSMDGHGVEAVFGALWHALMPKSYLSTGAFATLNLHWPCFGWFDRLVMDNGREFHAESVADALASVGIIAEFSKPHTPNDKPFIERFQRTFNYSFIHRLPGTTLSKVHQRVGFKSEDEAALTLEELERLIHVWICSKYHVRPHKGLGGRSPLSVWEEGSRAYPPQLKCNADDVQIEFSESQKSKLQHYGIDLNTYRYNSPRLNELFRALPPRSSVEVKWPKRDIGHIFVWDPLEREYIKVHNVDDELHGLSLAQGKEVARHRAAGATSSTSARASAGNVIRDVISTALADKALKSRRQGARTKGLNSRQIRGPKAAAPVALPADTSAPSQAPEVIGGMDFEVEIDGVVL